MLRGSLLFVGYVFSKNTPDTYLLVGHTYLLISSVYVCFLILSSFLLGTSAVKCSA